MVINSYNATKSYTAMALKTFSNFQLQINDTELYTIPLVYASASRLYKKLAKPDKTFSYRTVQELKKHNIWFTPRERE